MADSDAAGHADRAWAAFLGLAAAAGGGMEYGYTPMKELDDDDGPKFKFF